RRMPGRRPLWNLKARVIASVAIITMTAMSIVLKDSCGNLCRLEESWSATEGLLAYTRNNQYESQPTNAVSIATSLMRSLLKLYLSPSWEPQARLTVQSSSLRLSYSSVLPECLQYRI